MIRPPQLALLRACSALALRASAPTPIGLGTSPQLLRLKERAHGAGDNELFAGSDHENPSCRLRSRHVRVGGRALVQLGVELDAQKPETSADVGSDSCRVLADACREDQGVEPAQCCCSSPRLLPLPDTCTRRARAARIRHPKALPRAHGDLFLPTDLRGLILRSGRGRPRRRTGRAHAGRRGVRPDRSSRIASPSGRLRAARTPSSCRPSVRRLLP